MQLKNLWNFDASHPCTEQTQHCLTSVPTWEPTLLIQPGWLTRAVEPIASTWSTRDCNRQCQKMYSVFAVYFRNERTDTLFFLAQGIRLTGFHIMWLFQPSVTFFLEVIAIKLISRL
jgi:hypothetical protein